MKTPPAPQPDWAYFLDLDGTLVDLASAPDAIRVTHDLVVLIRDIHRRTGGAVALVSGRSLGDLDRHLGLEQLPASGQHGLERREATGRIRRHRASAVPVQHVADAVAPLAARHPGLLVENKGATIAVHYRRAPQLGGYLHRLLRRVADGCEGVELQRGKLVLEIKPSACDKGTAVADFMEQPPFRGRVPVFVGDDVTDERAFEAVNRLGGISIKVGPGHTAGRFRLADVAAVRSWLGSLAERLDIDDRKETA